MGKWEVFSSLEGWLGRGRWRRNGVILAMEENEKRCIGIGG